MAGARVQDRSPPLQPPGQAEEALAHTALLPAFRWRNGGSGHLLWPVFLMPHGLPAPGSGGCNSAVQASPEEPSSFPEPGRGLTGGQPGSRLGLTTNWLGGSEPVPSAPFPRACSRR